MQFGLAGGKTLLVLARGFQRIAGLVVGGVQLAGVAIDPFAQGRGRAQGQPCAGEQRFDLVDPIGTGIGIAGEPGGDVYEGVIAALKEIYDPEIPVNIYDLGLIYGVDVSPDNHVVVTMTLTTPHCPVAESMPGEVELRVGSVPGVGVAEVNLVWDPPWDPQKMSDEAKLELGML